MFSTGSFAPRSKAKPGRCSLALFFGLTLFVSASSLAQQTSLAKPTGERSLEARVHMFEARDRAKWQKPEELIKVLNVKPGMTIADIGAGSGYFARRFARAVGPTGRVYAVDISTDILDYLKKRARKEGLDNIETIVGRPDDPMLPPNSADLVFFAETTHHIARRVEFFRKVYTDLKADGRMVVIDFPPQAHAMGWCPHEPYELVPSWEIIREAEDAGFKTDRTYDFIKREYFTVFDRGAATWKELVRRTQSVGNHCGPG